MYPLTWHSVRVMQQGSDCEIIPVFRIRNKILFQLAKTSIECIIYALFEHVSNFTEWFVLSTCVFLYTFSHSLVSVVLKRIINFCRIIYRE